MGRWSCRQCRHLRVSRSRGKEDAVDVLQRAIIDDEKNQPSHLDQQKHLEQLESDDSDCETGHKIGEEDEDDNGAEAEDEVAPLQTVVSRAGRANQCSDKTPGHIVLLLDTSGSMRIEDVLDSDKKSALTRLDAAASCAAEFVKKHTSARKNDLFSLVSFGEVADVLSQATDVAGLCESLGTLPARAANGTRYTAALRAALGLFKLCPVGPIHVVLLSDGRPADTKEALEVFQRDFLGNDRAVRLHGIGFGAMVQSFAPLQQLACLSGGTFSLSECSVRGLQHAFSSVSSTITSVSSGHLRAQANDDRDILQKMPRAVNFEPPELNSFGRRGAWHFRAGRSTFRFDGTQFHTQRWPSTDVSRRARPFIRGGMRLVFGFMDRKAVDESSWMVAKCSRFQNEALNSLAVVEAHAKSTAVARYYSARFNDMVRVTSANSARLAPEILFVPCFVYEVTEEEASITSGTRLPQGESHAFAAERYLPGAFLKYNSNNGYICERSLRHADAAQAFAHFSFVASKGDVLVADLQGVARESELLLTDPQVLSLQRSYGPGDLGAAGMHACLAAHRCGPACRALGLKPVSAAVLRRLVRERQGGHGRHGAHGAGDTAASWEMLGSQHSSEIASDWDHVATNNPSEYALSEAGIKSSEVSGSSWVHLLDA